MEMNTVRSPRMRFDHMRTEGSQETHLDLESVSHDVLSDDACNQMQSMSALDILRETVRILRYNCAGFMLITMLLICPVSAVLLSNALVDQSIVKQLSIRLMLVAKSSGLPLRPLVKQSCQHFAEMVVSSTVCFPLYFTLLLLSKTAVVYSVECSYSRKIFAAAKFCLIVAKLWKRIALTYMWACAITMGCITLFCVLLVAFCSSFSVVGFSPGFILYAAIMVGLIFSIVFANVIIICNIALVICVLEDISGPQALLRSSMLISGQTQVGLVMYLGSTIGMAFVESLFENRVKTLSYGDGSSRVWEGPLLVILYSLVLLIDSMMSAVFYFSCRSISMETSNGEGNSILETMAVSSETTGFQ